MFLYQNKRIGGLAYPDGYLTIGEVTYPINWWNNAAQRTLHGVTLAADIPQPDPHLYNSTENDNGAWNSSPRDPGVIAAEDAAAALRLADEVDKAAVRIDAAVRYLMTHTPVEIKTYVETAVPTPTTLATCITSITAMRGLLTKLAQAVSVGLKNDLR